MDRDALWELAPIFFSKEYAKEVGEAPVFDFNNYILVFVVKVDNEIVSFCVNEFDGNRHNWRYDYTLPEWRGNGLNQQCFDMRDAYCGDEPCYIEVRQERESALEAYGFKTVKKRGQWRFMQRG